MKTIFLAALFAFCTTLFAAENTLPMPATSRLDRANLLLFHDAKGNAVQGSNKRDWEKRHAEILRNIQLVMGKLPGNEKRCPLDMKVIEEVDCGSYVRRKISYQSEPNSRTPAYLLIPKIALGKKTKVRAVLCLHPTDMQFGNKVVVGLSPKENRSYASELAERGFVTLAPAYPLLADYAPDWKSLGYKSGTMKAIWDNVRGIDLERRAPARRGSPPPRVPAMENPNY